MKVVNLTTHKNNKRQRALKELRSRAVKDIKDCVRPDDVAGYCVISWNDRGDTNCGYYIASGLTPPLQIPIMLAGHLINRNKVEI